MMRTSIFTLLLFALFTSCSQKRTATQVEGDLYRIMDMAGLKEKHGYVNKKGDTVIPLDKYLMCFTDTIKTIGFVTIRNKGYYAIDKNDQILFKVYPDDNGPDYMNEGLFRILDENDLIGFANMDGEVVIEPKFENIDSFREGLACFCVGCKTGGYKMLKEDSVDPKIRLFEKKLPSELKMGYINTKGDTIIQPIFDFAHTFRDGKAWVIKDARRYYIDKKGNEIKNPDQDGPDTSN